MLPFLLKRLIFSVFTLLGVSAITFFAVFASGDPAAIMLPSDAGTAQIEEYRRIMGLDRPVYVQYFYFLTHAVRGDFGRSLRHDLPAMALVLQRLPATMLLATSAVALATLIGIPLGIIAARRRGSWLDDIIVTTSSLGLAAPTFWIGTMLIVLFAVTFPIFPPSGGGSLSRLVLPSITLAAGFIAVLARFTRSEMLDILSKQYVATAHAKGLYERQVLIRHALRNALIPIITIIGMEMGSLLGGAVVTENVFAWPGIGRLMVNAVYDRDFPVVVAAVLVAAFMFIVINLIVDVLYSWLNPMVRYN